MSVAARRNAPGISLAEGLRALAVWMPPQAQARLQRHVDLLAKWNRTYNLTAIREPERMVTHHVLDALAVLPHLPARESLRVLDVGSGGGVPGIPLAIARPHWHVTLLDSNGKKTTFLTQAAIELGLQNVDVATSRVEAFQPAQPYDVAISRAFSDLGDFATGSARHLARDGVLAAMKGVHPDEELAQLPEDIEVIAAARIDVPGLDAQRHLIVMRPRSTR
jgi:16S rRNA (guanine527-N7)-methyltransferase